VTRWASFDCYGTLIDWNGGIRAELARVFGEGRADELLHRYHELEPELELDGNLSYREVMTEAMRRLGGRRFRRYRPRSRSCAGAAGSSRSSRTPTSI
jgi:2-haloacid dehalogenase